MWSANIQPAFLYYGAGIKKPPILLYHKFLNLSRRRRLREIMRSMGLDSVAPHNDNFSSFLHHNDYFHHFRNFRHFNYFNHSYFNHFYHLHNLYNLHITIHYSPYINTYIYQPSPKPQP